MKEKKRKKIPDVPRLRGIFVILACILLVSRSGLSFMVAFKKAIPNSISLIFPIILPLVRGGPPIAREVGEEKELTEENKRKHIFMLCIVKLWNLFSQHVNNGWQLGCLEEGLEKFRGHSDHQCSLDMISHITPRI